MQAKQTCSFFKLYRSDKSHFFFNLNKMSIQKINKTIYRKSEMIAIRLTRKNSEINSIDFEEKRRIIEQIKVLLYSGKTHFIVLISSTKLRIQFSEPSLVK